jgi:hypothetical protein
MMIDDLKRGWFEVCKGIVDCETRDDGLRQPFSGIFQGVDID